MDRFMAQRPLRWSLHSEQKRELGRDLIKEWGSFRCSLGPPGGVIHWKTEGVTEGPSICGRYRLPSSVRWWRNWQPPPDQCGKLRDGFWLPRPLRPLRPLWPLRPPEEPADTRLVSAGSIFSTNSGYSSLSHVFIPPSPIGETRRSRGGGAVVKSRPGSQGPAE